jgi:hypothetical protein
MIEASLLSAEEKHDQAIAALPKLVVSDPYLESASAIARANVFRRAGERDRAEEIVRSAIRSSELRGLDHFTSALRNHVLL